MGPVVMLHAVHGMMFGYNASMWFEYNTNNGDDDDYDEDDYDGDDDNGDEDDNDNHDDGDNDDDDDHSVK